MKEFEVSTNECYHYLQSKPVLFYIQSFINYRIAGGALIYRRKNSIVLMVIDSLYTLKNDEFFT